jgi:uncharacterized membrane protein YphA (DoxX/SURF4 family)/phosphoheptose isomerase
MEKNNNNEHSRAARLNNWETAALTVLRVAVGWHFLYEGIAKLTVNGWSAESYLANTTGLLAPFYHWIAASPIIAAVDWMNIAGLLLIGAGLCLGVASRTAAAAGAILLMLYYFAYPPFGFSLATAGGDSHLFVVNFQLVEAIVLLFLVFYRNAGYGLTGFWAIIMAARARNFLYDPPATKACTRREAIKHLASTPIVGLMGWGAYENSKRYGTDVMSGATIQLSKLDLSQMEGEMPKGKIMGRQISRLVLGGNLIGGWSHGRDLLYTNQLFKAYNTERKIYETLQLAEQAGINTINIGFPTVSVLAKYKKITGSRINVITQIGISEKSEDIFDNVTVAIDNGIDIIQLNGEWTDKLVNENRIETVGHLMERIRKEGCIAGMGAHVIDSLLACEQQGILPDYYMKTMHHHNYWSVQNHDNTYRDNKFCFYPERTIEFVNRINIPVMGFKVLAAGAIKPEDGFKWAFANGADFICVGMFDFQIVKDVNICINTLKTVEDEKLRQRPWFG